MHAWFTLPQLLSYCSWGSVNHLPLISYSCVCDLHSVVVSMYVYSVETLRQLSASLFSGRYSEPVSKFLLPAIARDSRFPFVRLLHSLLPSKILASVNSVAELSCDWCLAVEPTVWLLHSTLTLAAPHLGRITCHCPLQLHCWTCCWLINLLVLWRSGLGNSQDNWPEENCSCSSKDWFGPPFPQHLRNDDCLVDKREDDQNCSVLYYVRQLCTVICMHVWAVLEVDCWINVLDLR